MRRLALFDIDCTLIDPHGAGGRAIFAAVEETYGVRGGLDGYSFHGRTDPGIVVDLATRWGAPADMVAARLPECLDRYVARLRLEVAAEDVKVLPGVRELTTALACDRRVLVGLLTGNVEPGARVKLSATGLDALFAIGAYGSDSARRSDLPAVAIARAEQHTGYRFSGKEIAVIGDAPNDITCGAEHGVKAIAVATGMHTTAELAAHRPDYLFADLSDWRRVYESILA
jgi:phosphoglycolate phosphatase-like HAD superfamily hydrolase